MWQLLRCSTQPVLRRSRPVFWSPVRSPTGLQLEAWRSLSTAAAAGEYEAEVAQRLQQALGATACEVVDRSGGCGQSFVIKIEAEQFRGKSRIQQQRLVQHAIKEDIAKWHAVTIQTSVPPQAS
mmetsp:Transcript_66899/g.118871  ORF Transcript_66899/g.118871 Transcript_66899/m.118871 type:complete len:124 (+) Transcript_66899:118-489(+)